MIFHYNSRNLLLCVITGGLSVVIAFAVYSITAFPKLPKKF